MKQCKSCGETKPLGQYYEMASGKLGRAAKCIPCYIEHYKKRYRDNCEDRKAYQREYGKQYRKTQRWAVNAKEAKRKASQRNATPPWLTKEHLAQIKDVYRGAKEMETVFPWKQEVDHIVPIRGKTVSGLHVPWNLQILSARENASKSNSFSERLICD